MREGYSGGYYTEGDGFEESVDTGNIYYQLDEILGTRRENGARVKYAGSVVEYWITGLDVTIRNACLLYTSFAGYMQLHGERQGENP